MTAEKVALSGEKETLLLTLYCKGEESRFPDTLLNDHYAAAAVERIDYDFSRMQATRDIMIAVALRASILDRWAKAFLAFHPGCTVLHLGCGLDSRFFRIDPPADVRWYDVDYPEVIELRRRLYPERPGYHLIGTALTDPDWLGQVPADRPALILAEGVTPYLPEAETLPLLDRLSAHFPSGEMAFDAYSRLGLGIIRRQPFVRATGAQVHWSLEDPRAIEKAIPRLHLMQDLYAYSPDGYDPVQLARMTASTRAAIWLFQVIPALGKVGRLLRFRF
jgi:O-methyltransferase involved in polyketide biosynthesis